MKLKNYYLLLLLAAFTFTAQAQKVDNSQNPDYAIITPIHVTSMASRINELIPADMTRREAKDKRSLGNKVIIGKDKQTQDDYFTRNRHEDAQSVRVMPPSVVFDANTRSTDSLSNL